MIRKSIVVTTSQEDSAKLSSSLVQKASRFTSFLWIEEGSKRVNAKSIMGVLSMRITKGSRFDLICTGEDEEQAVEVLSALLEKDA